MTYSIEYSELSPHETRLNQAKQQALKRALDVLLSLLGLVALSPVMAVIALLIKLDSPGPVIFRHRRVGQGGVTFHMYKFRSMVTGGDDKEYMRYLADLIETGRGESRECAPYRKMDADSRVTRVGRILRLLYLDELPQLWNVLRGEMSLVGPRPHVQFEVDHYLPHQRRRLSARPGCTGLWQVAGKADCTFDELIDLDLEYIDHWSMGNDLRIMLRTVLLMFQGGERVWARSTKRVPGTQARSSESSGG